MGEVRTHLGSLLLLLLRTPHRIELFLADAIEQRPHRDALAATLEHIINLLTPLGLGILSRRKLGAVNSGLDLHDATQEGDP
jgi:hypothetical protein